MIHICYTYCLKEYRMFLFSIYTEEKYNNKFFLCCIVHLNFVTKIDCSIVFVVMVSKMELI